MPNAYSIGDWLPLRLSQDYRTPIGIINCTLRSLPVFSVYGLNGLKFTIVISIIIQGHFTFFYIFFWKGGLFVDRFSKGKSPICLNFYLISAYGNKFKEWNFFFILAAEWIETHRNIYLTEMLCWPGQWKRFDRLSTPCVNPITSIIKNH